VCAKQAHSTQALSIYKSFVSRRRGEDSAVARRAEGNNDTNDLELELIIKEFSTDGSLDQHPEPKRLKW
jgi:hypothetical protein